MAGVERSGRKRERVSVAQPCGCVQVGACDDETRESVTRLRLPQQRRQSTEGLKQSSGIGFSEARGLRWGKQSRAAARTTGVAPTAGRSDGCTRAALSLPEVWRGREACRCPALPGPPPPLPRGPPGPTWIHDGIYQHSNVFSPSMMASLFFLRNQP